MTNLLLSAFSEFPKLDAGGSNKIIYQILKYIDYKTFNVSYHSSHFQKSFTYPINITQQINSSLKIKKKVGTNLFRMQELFRNLFSSSFYINRYLKKCNRYFENLTSLQNYDILHSHDFRTLYYLRKFNVGKKILTVHSKGSLLNDLKLYSKNLSKHLLTDYLRMENESIRIADVITFPSYAAKDQFIDEKKMNIEKNKIKVIYNGVDLQFINTVKPDENFKTKYSIPSQIDLLLVNIADHIEVKNIDLILKIVKYLKTVHKLNVYLVNVGNGPETKILKQLSHKLNISDRVRFLGRLSYTEIIKLLKIGDALISTADKVVFDLIILEAMAAGITVVASENGGNKEAIVNGENGYLVKDFSIEEFAEKIVNRISAVKLNAIESVKKFDLKHMVSKYQELYLS